MQDIEFAGQLLRAIKAYDEWLKWEFGEYEKIPKIADRKSHPVSVLKFPDDFTCE
jgi:lipopolysaccharide cholinephosphotransferase